jgi:hypothetical protein
MGDPFRPKLAPFREAGRYPLRAVLPFYLAMLALTALTAWLVYFEWTASQFQPVQEEGQLTSFGSDGKMGLGAWVRTADGKVHRLQAGREQLFGCRIGGTVQIERRGKKLTFAEVACPR